RRSLRTCNRWGRNVASRKRVKSDRGSSDLPAKTLIGTQPASKRFTISLTPFFRKGSSAGDSHRFKRWGANSRRGRGSNQGGRCAASDKVCPRAATKD